MVSPEAVRPVPQSRQCNQPIVLKEQPTSLAQKVKDAGQRSVTGTRVEKQREQSIVSAHKVLHASSQHRYTGGPLPSNSATDTYANEICKSTAGRVSGFAGSRHPSPTQSLVARGKRASISSVLPRRVAFNYFRCQLA